MLLLKELSEALRPRGLLLSAALSPGRQIIEPAYDLEQIGKSVWGHGKSIWMSRKVSLEWHVVAGNIAGTQ